MTMSGQIDIGWSVAPFGLKDLQAKAIRVVMRGSDVPSIRNQTVRVEIVNADALKSAMTHGAVHACVSRDA